MNKNKLKQTIEKHDIITQMLISAINSKEYHTQQVKYYEDTIKKYSEILNNNFKVINNAKENRWGSIHNPRPYIWR